MGAAAPCAPLPFGQAKNAGSAVFAGMLVNAANNFIDDDRQPFLDSLSGSAYNLSLPGARHANFNDYALQDAYISALIGGGHHGLAIGAMDTGAVFTWYTLGHPWYWISVAVLVICGSWIATRNE